MMSVFLCVICGALAVALGVSVRANRAMWRAMKSTQPAAAGRPGSLSPYRQPPCDLSSPLATPRPALAGGEPLAAEALALPSHIMLWTCPRCGELGRGFTAWTCCTHLRGRKIATPFPECMMLGGHHHLHLRCRSCEKDSAYQIDGDVMVCVSPDKDGNVP